MGLINSVAAQGRGGDTRVAHVTPGEVVIPKEVAALRPDLIAHISDQIRRMGGDPQRLTVGAGRVNPATGIEEFATQAEVEAAYQTILGRAPDAAGLAYWQGQSDLGAFKAAAAPEIASNVGKAYQTNFGRVADAGGQDYWQGQVKSGLIGTMDDLNSALKTNAQGQDVYAARDIAAGGVDTTTTWDSSLNPTAADLTYDAEANKWGMPSATKPVVATPTAAALPAPALVSSVAPATAVPVTANTTTLNPATDTVQGQIRAIIDQNSPLQRQAEARAIQQMNARGLLNSSMAVGAGQAALYDAALPIATQDANTYATVNREGTQAKNAAASQNATAQNQMAMFSAELASKVDMFNASQSNDLTKLGMDLANKQSLANIESSYKILMQGNQSASEIYKQTVKNITDIAANKDMGQAAKDAATNNQIAMLQKGLEMTGAMSNLDLTRYLDFSDVAPVTPAAASNTTAAGTLPISESQWNSPSGLMAGQAGSPASRYAAYKAGGGTLNASDWYALIDQPRAA